ncbi:sec-independent protein translocase protein TatB [Vibrio sp. MACH09]|uniref:Sec-independent protein translocase protein TatB n=1 Tax=unclassified Vibrio TaxID=2614977 RepID=UPI001493646E|nr:Sec-independent protein translocase protein TatB [Vibrio sp. MACH09]NOI68509.1 Sec-independent protein translocase subunit TatB [Vibrio sp. 99-8-1]GLO59532.1 sec-independent protein translocase protein TatB [Vibrio sp. MACH09]
MFDIGFWELVLISVVGLVVLGPERLPVAIRSVSKFISGAKAMANGVKDELAHELKVQELQENLKKAEKMGMEELAPDLKASVEELKQAAADVQRPFAENSQSPITGDKTTSSSESSDDKAESRSEEKKPEL